MTSPTIYRNGLPLQNIHATRQGAPWKRLATERSCRRETPSALSSVAWEPCSSHKALTSLGVLNMLSCCEQQHRWGILRNDGPLHTRPTSQRSFHHARDLSTLEKSA